MTPNPPGSDFTYQRNYPTGDLFAHVTGYYTFAFGSTGLERTQNDVLTGSTPEQELRAIPGIVTGDEDSSGTVQMALRSDLQQVAKDALGDREGSVVVIEPATGAVRAMWSFPTYDPNLIATPDFDRARDVITFLENYPGDPLLGNAYQQRYMPGSTFKILTTGIGLENGVIDLASTFPDETEFVPPQTNDPIQNFQGTTCGGDLTEVFTRSCNIAFAKTALAIGVDGMVDGVARWGVGERVPIDLPRPAASTFGPTDALDQNLPLLAIRGFGQNEVQMVPLHMAMIAGTVANGGQMMKPYVVEQTLDHDGRVLDRGRAGGVEDADLAGDGGHHDRPDGQRRRERHGELLHRPRGRRPRRRQDRHGAAQQPRRAGAIARLDRRLRPRRRAAALRRRRDDPRDQRGDLGEHGWAPGRPGRQDRPRRRGSLESRLMSPESRTAESVDSLGGRCAPGRAQTTASRQQ